MSKRDSADESENSADDNPYVDVEGEPLTCPECGEYVVVIYRPHDEYPPRAAGFWLECICVMVPPLDKETIEGFWPPWFVNKMDDDWVEYYLHENRDASKWTGDDDE